MKNKINSKYIILIVLVLVLAIAAAGSIMLQEISYEEYSSVSQLSEDPGFTVSGKLIISEIMSSNGGAYISEDGLCCDYCEIFNSTNESINLFGYGLSDDDSKVKWTFPDVDIKPGEYMVINLTGKDMSGLNASFKLSSSGGEKLILVNRRGRIIDAVDIIAMEKNHSMVRRDTGWSVVEYATPGFENSLEGLESYRHSIFSESDASIVINEFLCKNAGNFINENDRTDGFIEIKNNSDQLINLADYYLSDDYSSPFKFRLPEYYMSPEEIYLFYTGDNSYVNDKDYTGFKLSNGTGILLLCTQGKIVNKIDYQYIPNGCAYVRDKDGSFYISSAISAGFENTFDGITSFMKEYELLPEGLIISEVMSSNNSYLPQNGTKYYDWIELKNNSNRVINLSDYYITNNINDKTLYRLETVNLQPGEYYILMCSGNTELSNDKYQHSNFKIGNAESIYIVKEATRVVDCCFVYGIPTNCSFARGKEYGWTYSTSPSPGIPNKDGYVAVTPKPEIMLPAGVYNDVSSLTIELQGPGTIYYTTDGSIPSTGSKKYTGPFSISKTTVIKAAACISGEKISDYVCSSYIVNDPHDVPVISISLNQGEFNYLCSHYTQDLTYKAYFEFFEDKGSCGAPCGIALSGNTGRQYTKKNFALSFKSEYGSKSIDYKFFDDVDCSSFEKLVVRGGSNAESSFPWKDEFATDLASDSNLDTRSYKTCVVYINGVYKGMYNLREKINAEMIADHYNVSKDNLSIERWAGTLEYGTNVWTEVVKWAAGHDLSNEDNYRIFCSKVDVESLCDLWIYEMYMNNPDLYNIRVFSNPEVDGGRCKFIFFDLDLGWYGTNGSYYDDVIFNRSGYATDLAYQKYDVNVNLNLLKNANFRQLFLERLSYHLHNGLSTKNTLKVFDEFANRYSREIYRDMAANGYSTSWYTSNLYLFRNIVAARTNYLLQDTKRFFGLSSSQMSEIFGDLW